LIWNASASMPISLYAVQLAGVLHVSELVVIRPPEPLASFLADRGYLPKGVPLLLARPCPSRADRLACRAHHCHGDALEADRRGRPLPVWQRCLAIAPGQIFVMNSQSADSFDGRYFGPLPASPISGRADPLWTHDED
jgi:type IV secretory pathway protease TraF